jgi:uncharacterized protein YbjQ (UPF0145 family)
MGDLIIFLALLTLGFLAGRLAERRHYKSIREREKKLLYLPATSTKDNVLGDEEVRAVRLVYGNAVISIDYFKRFLAGLRNLFGGEVAAYESLIDRARREATIRMKDMARRSSADLIMNLRIETSSIASRANQKSVGSIEAYAYGTAIVLEKD